MSLPSMSRFPPGTRSPLSLPISSFPALRAVCVSALLACLSGPQLAGCGYEERVEKPPYCEVVELSGSPYDMGYQHGQIFASKIRSFYTQLLATGILPWLNREQPDIASVLTEYTKPLYDNGQFSYQVLLQSGQNLLSSMPKDYQDEIQGITDGSGFDFEKVLILNTLLDSMLNMRAITFLIRFIQAPQLLSVQFIVPGAGGSPEVVVGTIRPYSPSPYASLVEMPANAKIRFALQDSDGVDPTSIRIQLNRQTFLYGDPGIGTRTAGRNGNQLEVDFQPANGFASASVVSVQIQAGDLTWIDDPPPGHARIMRDERIIFTTQGYGKESWEVENRGEKDERTQPPPLAFALRNSATTEGKVIAAHHFALLDSGTSHKHNALMIRRPTQGKAHAVMGWAGIVYGFSGINSDGLVFMAHISDSLNNSMAGEILRALVEGRFREAKLLASGTMIGIEGRKVLTAASNVQEALDLIGGDPQTFGWNILLAEGNRADKGQQRTIAAVEVDADILHDTDGGFLPYTPDEACADEANCDSRGRPWASVGPDDLRIAAHYRRNTEDINIGLFGFPIIEPQRFWTSYYFRSNRGFYLLQDQLRAHYGGLDVPLIMQVMRIEDFVDYRDSMNAVIYEPEDMRMHYAAGQVPATDGPFIPFDLSSPLGLGGDS